ncbi:MAG: NAD(P)-dependent oxidoreductase [Planctomycetales bacterium]
MPPAVASDRNPEHAKPHDIGPEAVGCIGLGLLGLAMAQRAMEHGVPVVGFDLVPERRQALRDAGGHAADSADEVARRCRRVFLALPHDGISRQVALEIAPWLPEGGIILDAATGDAQQMAQLGDWLAERRVTYLDTSVSGSSAQARIGDIVLLVGGAPEGVAQCQDLFRILAKETIHAGPCGTGAKLKLVTNLVLGLNRAALAEGLVLATALGLSPEQALAALQAGMSYSRTMETKGPKMIRRDFEPQARLSQHLKDVRLILAAAERKGQPLPLSEAHRTLLELAEEQGWGTLDNCAIIQAIEVLRGTRDGKKPPSG